MLNSEYNERFSFIKRYPYQYSSRYIILSTRISDERQIGLEYFYTTDCFRKSFICTESPYSSRFITTRICRLKETSNRFCSVAVIANSAERTCYFKVNAKIMIHSVSLQSSFTYFSEKHIWVHKDPITQRTVIYTLGIYSEKQSYIERIHKMYVSSSNTMLSIERVSERSVLLQLMQNYDIRTILFSLAGVSERFSLLSNAHTVLIHSFDTLMSLSNLYSQRYVHITLEAPFSERVTIYTHVPCSERFIYIALKIVSERFISLMVYRPFAMHSFIIEQAIPKVTERICMYRMIESISLRYIYVETRPMYSSKKPLTMSDLNTLMSSTDTQINVAINSDREMTINGTGITLQQNFNTIDSSKVVFTASNKSYAVSIVDYTGASISANSENNIKTLLSSSIFCLDITLT